ncbi:MAG: hypothetical protein ACREWE_14705 [Gammaproteobacteria bacterium]
MYYQPLSNSHYEEALSLVRQETGARAVILIFERGAGIDFSVQAMGDLAASLPEYLDDLSAKLRDMRRRGMDG